MRRKIVLCILDGWGMAPDSKANGISAAKHWPNILKKYPHTILEASENFMGLPKAQMGNSEVGHMAIGLGRILRQDLPAIDEAFATGAILKNPKVLKAIAELKASGKPCHALGLLSPGGVHSHVNHLRQAAITLAERGITVFVHAFLDGRDTPPRSAAGYMKEFAESLKNFPSITVATIGGRYYAMDRDNRFERVEKAYGAIVKGHGEKFLDPAEAILRAYAAGVDDEFIVPMANANFNGANDGDGLWMLNFRADRVRQILKSLLFENFTDFTRDKTVKFGPRLAMNEYADFLSPYIPSIFSKPAITNGLGETLANAGLKQLRVAETEKYAHVTFFFNGGIERPFDGEERILIPSPKVSTYDLCPEMSAMAVTRAVLEAMDRKDLSFIAVNFANADMVGHTGVIDAIKKAVVSVDSGVWRIVDKALACGWTVLITADHGNAERMLEADHTPHTAHTCNPVPFVMVNGLANASLAPGTLADIAPTVLKLLDIDKPLEMTGKVLTR